MPGVGTAVTIQDDIQKIRAADRSTYVTLPWLTKYEFDQVIGLRTMQLSKGAVPFVKLPPGFSIKSNMELRKVAIDELKQARLPYMIKRPLPSGKAEYWPVDELALDAVVHLMR